MTTHQLDEKAFTKALKIWERKALEGIQHGHILNAEEEGRIIIEAYEQAKQPKQPDPREDCPWKCKEDNTYCRCIKAKRPSISDDEVRDIIENTIGYKFERSLEIITALTPYLNLEK